MAEKRKSDIGNWRWISGTVAGWEMEEHVERIWERSLETEQPWVANQQGNGTLIL